MKITLSSTSHFTRPSRTLMMAAIIAMLDFNSPYLQLSKSMLSERFPDFKLSEFLKDAISFTFEIVLDSAAYPDLRFEKTCGQFCDSIFYPVNDDPVIKIHPILFLAIKKALLRDPFFKDHLFLDILFPVRSSYARNLMHFVQFNESKFIHIEAFWKSMGITSPTGKKMFLHRRGVFIKELIKAGFCESMEISLGKSDSSDKSYQSISFVVNRKHTLSEVEDETFPFRPYPYIKPLDFLPSDL